MSQPKAFWGKCPDSHVFPIHPLPMQMSEAAKMLRRAVCPFCLSKKLKPASQDDGVCKETITGVPMIIESPFPTTGQFRLENTMETEQFYTLQRQVAKDGTPLVPVGVLIEPRRIADMIVGAVEGGSAHWLKSFRAKETAVETPTKPWYDDPRVWCHAFVVEAIYETANDGSRTETKTLMLYNLIHGLHLMAAKEPRDFGDMLAEHDDAATADVFMQYFVLGEIVYG